MKGDFTGFSFDGIHSSQLNIVHVSSSDRYNEELFPEVKDKTIEIPNNHGEYYYGSTYGTRTFEIEIAFDSVTEKQFRQIRRLFSTTKICQLIFDERPYKVYYAKAESPIELSYICFDEKDWEWDSENHNGYIPGSIDHKKYLNTKRRIYKGEGTINLICYFPFARQLYKIKELYETPFYDEHTGNTFTAYTNIDEWIESSGILDNATFESNTIDQVQIANGEDYRYFINVYNPGDLDVGFCLYIPFNSEGKISPNTGKQAIIINGDDNTLYLNEITQLHKMDTGILINTVNHLIEGVNFSHIAHTQNIRYPSWIITGSIYNQFIKAGDFPHIIKSDWYFDNLNKQTIYIDCADLMAVSSQSNNSEEQEEPAETNSQESESTETNTQEQIDSTESTNSTNQEQEGDTQVEPNIVIYYNYLYF